MERNGRPRRRPEAPSAPPTTITELARRYHSCAVALSRSLGIPMSEAFVLKFHNAISSIFIAADRAGVRLPSAVQLPPLAGSPTNATNGHAVVAPRDRPTVAPAENSAPAETKPAPVAEQEQGGAENPAPNGDTLMLRVPEDSGLPCAGVFISALKPPQLAMLISKVARLLHDEGERWVRLLHALEMERNARLAQGRKPRRPDPDLDPVGHMEVEGEDDVP